MKKLAAILLVMAFASPALADDVKTRFYNFEDLMVEGQIKKPQVLYTDARQKVKFDRLLKLKKDFLPKLKATAKDATLR
ncbi:hypothetical protein KKF91_06825 [Myxococcota bacterium]|nr:hypothetical protein [Myxococcota bacterium]MBU1430268.1 hypothetical protein [Myxococcota bacterium]MBU1897587.1 hypothetical protein [Myxococcota bacterium]